MPTRKFKPGESGNPAGRPGGHHDGRPPNEFKHWLAKTIHNPKARKRFEQIINDEEGAETKVTDQGVEVPVRAQGRTYLQAMELGLGYAEGKPNQPYTHEEGESRIRGMIDELKRDHERRFPENL